MIFLKHLIHNQLQLFVIYIIGLPSVVDKFQTWMKKNKTRNANKEIKFNITGDMSCMALASFPYCLKHAAWLIQDYELTKIRKHIENVVQQNKIVSNIEVHIDWKYESNDSNNTFDQNDLIDKNDNHYKINTNVSNKSFESTNNLPIHLNTDSEMDHSSANDDDDAKQEILSDNDIDIETPGNNVLHDASVVDLGSRILPQNEASKITGINYIYKYKVENDDTLYTFDNNDNAANVKYSRTFNLAVMFDYTYLFKYVFGVLCTLRWDKKIWTVTPPEIKNAQIAGRSALYKAELFFDCLLHEYAWLVGGNAPYMLEAFWHYNPFGYGIYSVCQQMCENFCGWIKEDRRQCGSGNNDNYLREIARNSDLNVLARMYYDQIDLKEIANQEKLKHISTFDSENNFQIKQQLLSESPLLFQKFGEGLGELKVNDIIPQYMKDVSDNNGKNDSFVKVKSGLKKYCDNADKDSDDDDSNDHNNDNKQDSVATRWRHRISNMNQLVKNVQKSQMNQVKQKSKKQSSFKGKKKWSK